MERQTKSQKCKDLFDVYKCIKEDRPVKREGAKDGSISIKPFFPVVDIPEKEVLKQCLIWLRKHGIIADRLNTGAGELGISGYRTYGIIGGGDIIAILPNGKHLEIETKAGRGGRLGLRQQKRMKKILDNNGFYFIVCSITELIYYIEPLL